MMLKRITSLFIFCVVYLSAFAQDIDSMAVDSMAAEQRLRDSLAAEIEAQEAAEAEDLTQFSQKNPRMAVNSHLYFLQEDSYEPLQSARVLLAPDATEKERIELAKKLKEIYDGEGFYVELEDIPNDENYQDSSGRNRYIVDPSHPEIYVQKYGEYWYYSRRTVNAINPIHNGIYPYGSDLFQDLIPGIGNNTFLGLQINQWAGILILLLAAFIAYKILGFLSAIFIKWILPLFIKDANITSEDANPVARPLSWLLVCLLLIQFIPVLQFDIKMNQYMIMGLRILASIFGIILASRLIDLIAMIAKKLTAYTETTMDDQLVPLLVRIIRIIVVVFGIIFILQNLGVNVTALLAGVSIGGLALALAAQDTVKNFIGSISIFTDRPFQIGDFVTAAGITGTVEEVGVRSTRIREIDGTQTSIPNGNLANQTINNGSRRIHRRYATTLTVTYSTSTEQIEQFVEAVRAIAEGHEHTKEGSVNVRFQQFADSSLNIFFAVAFTRNGYPEMLESQQVINLQIMQKAAELGVDFAFPTTTVHLEK